MLGLKTLFVVGILSSLGYLTQSLTFTLSRDEIEVLQVKLSETISKTSDEELTEFSNQINNTTQPVPNLYAVLVAGSNGFYNYRHQADVCHAYQILHKSIPDENIVVMMYDDIAQNPENPTPGVIINRPNGTNVYAGVTKDYIGKDVNPDTFLKVLLGDESGLKGIGSGKVLKSGPNDHVFINFVDHGAPGLVAFPDQELYAKDLEKVLKKMYQSNKFGKLVFYLEACESGSMFDGLLPKHMNIFATTAANSVESSYACYYDETRNTYLGDVYSVMWMENTDQVDVEQETLQKQFLVVKNETNTSHVMEYGDFRLRKLPVADFLGHTTSKKNTYPPAELDAVSQGDVPRILLERKISSTENLKERKELEMKLSRFHKMRSLVTSLIMEILSTVTLNDVQEKSIILRSRFTLTDHNCYDSVAKYFSAHCFSIAKNPYVMQKLYLFVNLCERGWSSESMIEVMANTCHQSPGGTYSGIY